MTDSVLPAPLFDLTGRVALITGGSRGLGREMTRAFAAAGADVVIASRSQESCDLLAREVAERTGRVALAHACHVGRWDGLDELVDAAYSRFGRLDVLVNNAGMSPPYESVDSISQDLYRKVLDVNLTGPFRLTALAGARMAAGGGGSIVNISSVAATVPSPEALPYAAAKAGLEALTRGFAHAFGPTVRVNAVRAGTFATDVAEAWDRAAVAVFAEDRFALRRVAEPREIVGTVLYLASGASSYTTGSIITVDGGRA